MSILISRRIFMAAVIGVALLLSAIAGQRAAAARAQGPFTGSQRELRGMILSLLRASDAPLTRSSVIEDVAREARVKQSRVLLSERSLIEDRLIRRIDHMLTLGSSDI